MPTTMQNRKTHKINQILIIRKRTENRRLHVKDFKIFSDTLDIEVNNIKHMTIKLKMQNNKAKTNSDIRLKKKV